MCERCNDTKGVWEHYYYPELKFKVGSSIKMTQLMSCDCQSNKLSPEELYAEAKRNNLTTLEYYPKVSVTINN
jgi:hypothetical protein